MWWSNLTEITLLPSSFGMDHVNLTIEGQLRKRDACGLGYMKSQFMYYLAIEKSGLPVSELFILAPKLMSTVCVRLVLIVLLQPYVLLVLLLQQHLVRHS